MAAAMEMMTGASAFGWLPVFAALIVALLVWSSYRHIARIFKWLTLVCVRLCSSRDTCKTAVERSLARDLPAKHRV